MSTFPLEDEKLNEDITEVSVVSTSSINYIALIFGIFFVLLGFLDMVILYVIPNNRIRENKKKLPDATFKKPNPGVIAVHFILHTLIILIGVFLILFGLDINRHRTKIGLIAVCIITAFCWVVVLAVDFSLTTHVKSKMTVNELITMISQSPPIDFAFVYTSDVINDRHCSGSSGSDCDEQNTQCYSKTGIVIPMDTKINSPIFNFTNTPKMFYFTYEKKLNMTTLFKANFDNIMNNIKNCDKSHKKVTEYYPLTSGTYIVSYDKIPSYLTKSTRIASIFFGAGIYYELSSKSVPFITYNQNVDVDVVDNVNYNTIFLPDNCKNLGECSIYNKKPKPN